MASNSGPTNSAHALDIDGDGVVDRDYRGLRNLTAALDLAARTEVLKGVETEQEFFLPLLLLQLYAGYYQQPEVLTALGQRPAPPFPGGYELPGDDGPVLQTLRTRR